MGLSALDLRAMIGCNGAMTERTDIAALPDLPRLPGVFVTGTDTEVGKTVIAAAICRSLREAGVQVEPFKPAATGCRRSPGGLISEDAELLAAAAESTRTLAQIAPLRYPAALSPNVAARRAGKKVDIETMLDEYRRLEGACDAVVVEGVGGLMCPISDDFWVIHLAAMTHLPLVIVARPGLGAINHTLLTVHAARAAGIRIAGVVINRYEADPSMTEEQAAGKGDAVLAMHTNPQQIADRAGVPVLALVPEDRATSVRDAEVGRGVQFAVDTVDWRRVAGM